MPTVRSHVKKRHVYFKNNGRYTEVTRDAVDQVDNNSTDATKQKKLAKSGSNSAAAVTMRDALKEMSQK